MKGAHVPARSKKAESEAQKKEGPRIERELERKISADRPGSDEALGADDPLEIVVQLSSDDPDTPDSPEHVREKVEALLERSAELTGESPEDYHVFSHMQSLVVRGPRTFLRTLLDQPGVLAAVENRSGGRGVPPVA